MPVQQNLGAALRAAYFLGAAGVLACVRNSAPLSPAVSKASAGALEFMPVHACDSMPRTLTQAASQGWHIIGEPSC
jgi:21S rRNA (GM2251-2'-O)-methyltransferase